MTPRLAIILFVIVMLFVSAGLVMHGVAQLLGTANPELMTVFMGSGAVGVAVSAVLLWGLVTKTPASSQAKAETLLSGWQSALAQGDYVRAQTIVEAAMQRLPTAYTQIPGIMTYLHQGQFDKVQLLAQQVIRDHSDTKSKADQERAKPILSQVYSLLADAAMFQHDFDTAANHLEDANGYQPQDALSFHTMAKFSLYQGDLERANLDLTTASIRIRKQGQAPSGLHLALRAWSTAQRHDEYNALALIQTALKKTPAHDKARRAEIHLIQGYVERSLTHPNEARHAFETSISCDPQGVYGSQARAELEKTRA